jgi:penicillin-binding protein 1A
MSHPFFQSSLFKPKKWWAFILPYLKLCIDQLKGWKRKHEEAYKKAPWYGKILIVAADFIACFLVYLIIVDVNLFWLFGKSPGLRSINHPKHSYATEIYSSDGVLIGKLYRENRTPVAYHEISPLLIKTLIYTEDERFYQHFGIDFKGLLAAAKDLT